MRRQPAFSWKWPWKPSTAAAMAATAQQQQPPTPTKAGAAAGGVSSDDSSGTRELRLLATRPASQVSSGSCTARRGIYAHVASVPGASMKGC